jgi:hypothetical protein
LDCNSYCDPKDADYDVHAFPKPGFILHAPLPVLFRVPVRTYSAVHAATTTHGSLCVTAFFADLSGQLVLDDCAHHRKLELRRRIAVARLGDERLECFILEQRMNSQHQRQGWANKEGLKMWVLREYLL